MNPDVIVGAINEINNRTFDRKSIREKAVPLFDPIVIAKEHIRVYSEAIMSL
jgi:hypothetical protein